MGFDNDISDGVAIMSAATILGEIFRLYQRTKTPLKYVHTKSKYGHIVAIPASDTQELFSRAARETILVKEIILHSSGGKGENKVAMSQYLPKFLFEKYENEAIFAASQCGLSVSTSMKPESFTAVVDDSNIKLTSLIIICNDIRNVFGKRAILPEEAVHNLGTGCIEA